MNYLDIIKRGLPVLLGCLLLYGVYSHGVSVTNDKWQAKWDKADKEATKAALETSEHIRDLERSAATKMGDIDAAYQKGVRDEKAGTKHIIDGVNDGTYVLRDRFKCNKTVSTMPTSPGNSFVNNGAGESGLQNKDAEFLISEAGRADEIVGKLTACQAVISSLQASSIRKN